jgi:hypothetical protein
VQAVGAAIDAVAPHAQLIETGAADVRRLCKWLGTKGANTRFNNLMRYVLTESAPTARTPPSAPMATSAQCPLTAWHCSARISHCIQCPLTAWHCVHCRCPRAMLCDWNTLKEGGENGKRISRCNLEGYGGLDYETFGGDVSHVLDGLPEKRCPYPPMDVPGPGAGFDANGHWTGRGTARVA